jgi:hypothetical protein
MFLTILWTGGLEPGRLGLSSTFNVSDASFTPVPGLSDPTSWSFISDSTSSFGGHYITLTDSLT